VTASFQILPDLSFNIYFPFDTIQLELVTALQHDVQ